MDPMFHESSAPSTTNLANSFNPQDDAAGAAYQGGTVANDGSGFANQLGFGGTLGSHYQDTSAIHNFAQPHLQAPAASSEATAADTAADTSSSNQYSFPGSASIPDAMQDVSTHDGSGGVNFQTLLDNLSPTLSQDKSTQDGLTTSMSQTPQASPSGATSPSNALPGNPSLPPRPPPQEKPATHPNYAPEDDIRAYHPHSQKSPAASYRAQSLAQIATGSGATATTPTNGQQQQTPLSATPREPNSAVDKFPQGELVDQKASKGQGEEEDAPWGPDTQKLYDEFLHDERVNVTEGQWDKFPVNSRLFIGKYVKFVYGNIESLTLPLGNLPTEKVTKRDIFHVFHKHGKLAQISLKQAYGFVQFLDAGACYQALQAEQGMTVRGRKIRTFWKGVKVKGVTNLTQTWRFRNRNGILGVDGTMKVVAVVVVVAETDVVLGRPNSIVEAEHAVPTDTLVVKMGDRHGTGILGARGMTTALEDLLPLEATAAAADEIGVGIGTTAGDEVGHGHLIIGDIEVLVRGERRTQTTSHYRTELPKMFPTSKSSFLTT